MLSIRIFGYCAVMLMVLRMCTIPFLAFDFSITLLSIVAITCGCTAVVCSVSLIASGKMTKIFRVLNEGNTGNRCIACLFYDL